MADVSSKLLGQFAQNLERDVLSGDASSGDAADTAGASEPTPITSAPTATTGGEASTGPRTINSPEAQPVDLLDSAGGAVAKRVVPVIIAVGALLTLRALRKRRKRRKAASS
jgi:hypothetical protein